MTEKPVTTTEHVKIDPKKPLMLDGESEPPYQKRDPNARPDKRKLAG